MISLQVIRKRDKQVRFVLTKIRTGKEAHEIISKTYNHIGRFNLLFLKNFVEYNHITGQDADLKPLFLLKLSMDAKN